MPKRKLSKQIVIHSDQEFDFTMGSFSSRSLARGAKAANGKSRLAVVTWKGRKCHA